MDIKSLFNSLFPDKTVTRREIDLSGKKATLIQERIQERINNGELSQKYIDWFNENKDKTFTLKKYAKYKDFYEFEGVIWIFHLRDLNIEGWSREDYDNYWNEVL